MRVRQHLDVSRTTLDIDDDILRRLRQKALDEGRAVQAVTNDLLRAALHRGARAPFRLKLAGWKAEEQPGVDIADRDRLLDLMDGRS
jgi:plasmid stability protein